MVLGIGFGGEQEGQEEADEDEGSEEECPREVEVTVLGGEH